MLLYGQVAIDITRFIALEERSWVISVAGMLKKEDIAHLKEDEFPVKQKVVNSDGYWNNDGSMIVDPRGEIIAGPLIDDQWKLYPLSRMLINHTLVISQYDFLGRF